MPAEWPLELSRVEGSGSTAVSRFAKGPVRGGWRAEMAVAKGPVCRIAKLPARLQKDSPEDQREASGG